MDNKTKLLTDVAIWGYVDYLEERLSELDEIEDMTSDEELEYDKKTKELYKVLDGLEKKDRL